MGLFLSLPKDLRKQLWFGGYLDSLCQEMTRRAYGFEKKKNKNWVLLAAEQSYFPEFVEHCRDISEKLDRLIFANDLDRMIFANDRTKLLSIISFHGHAKSLSYVNPRTAEYPCIAFHGGRGGQFSILDFVGHDYVRTALSGAVSGNQLQFIERTLTFFVHNIHYSCVLQMAVFRDNVSVCAFLLTSYKFEPKSVNLLHVLPSDKDTTNVLAYLHHHGVLNPLSLTAESIEYVAGAHQFDWFLENGYVRSDFQIVTMIYFCGLKHPELALKWSKQLPRHLRTYEHDLTDFYGTRDQILSAIDNASLG
jgi:hypothetical protein